MVENPIIGNTYWCCEPNVQGYDYAHERDNVRPPRQMLLAEKQQPGGVLRVLWPLKPDGTANDNSLEYAVCSPRNDRLFETEAEALAHYKERLRCKADALEEEAAELRKEAEGL